MALNVIDYFATIGKREGPLKCQSSSLFKSLPETVQAANLRELWNLAITDIAIIANDVEEEAVDSSWEIISGEVAEDGLRPAKVGIKRRKESNKLSHIINVKIIPSGEALPIGFELLDTSFSGKYSGSFDTQGFLAVSRADISSAMFLEGQHILTDVIIALESKWMEVEEEYLSVGKVGVLHQKQKGKYALAYSRCPAMGICDLIYDSATVDRYPKQDHRGSHLPVEELPMFTFPSGMHLTYQSTNQCPLPMYFTFVFTDANGDHFYTACLLFYESVDINDIKPVFKEIYGDHMV